jgi:Ca2+-binding RTX toxin-like protein
MPSNRSSNSGHRDGRDNNFKFDITKSEFVSRNLASGDDQVEIKGDVPQVRITFTSVEVGNGDPNDSNTLANQDGDLAVRVQAEDALGNLTGPVSRFDDEGITFSTKDDALFDVRDLVTGVSRGLFDQVILGTSDGDTIDVSEEGRHGRHRGDPERHGDDAPQAYYINGGAGDDRITGAALNDFLVGGAGNDRLSGREGNDSFIGGFGDDIIRGGLGDDTSIFNITADGADSVNLGDGNDRATFIAPVGSQIRLTFTSAEVGNVRPNERGR